MNWNDARIFLAVVSEGSFAGAARDLGVTHPTVGRRMKALELELGGRLFVIGGQGVSLTARGETFLPIAQEMEQAALKLEVSKKQFSGPKGVVRISCASPMLSFLIENLADFTSAYPDISLEFDDTIDHLNLSRGEADIAIRGQLPEAGAIISKKLTAVDMAIYGAKSYLAHHPFEESSSLSEYSWVIHDERMAHYPYMKWLMPQLSSSTKLFRATRRYAQLEMIQQGLGLGVVPFADGRRFEELVRVTPPITELKSSLYILSHETTLNAARTRAVWDWIVKLSKEKAGLFGSQA